MNARKRGLLFTIAGCLLAMRAAASDDDVESRKLFAETMWGGVYTCSAVDERLHPENGNAQQTVLRVFERGYAIPKAHGQSFRKLASEKVDGLASEGRLAKYAEANCPHAEVGYMTTGKREAVSECRSHVRECPLSTRSGPFAEAKIGQHQQDDQHQRVVQTVPECCSAFTEIRIYAERDPLPSVPSTFVSKVVYPLLDRGQFALADAEFGMALRSYLRQFDDPIIVFDAPIDRTQLVRALSGFGRLNDEAPSVVTMLVTRIDVLEFQEVYFRDHPEACSRRHHAAIDAEALRWAYTNSNFTRPSQ